jgi:hypothetical protein
VREGGKYAKERVLQGIKRMEKEKPEKTRK